MALDEEVNDQLLQTLAEMRGKTTVLLVTHRPSHLKLVDKILLLQQGQLILQGPAQQILPKIKPEML